MGNTDQGPPGGRPNSFPDACGNGWTCEHRWSSIMNMVRFANVAVGTGVENWDGGDHYLGFSRGSKAFVAMGNLNREFYTGLLYAALFVMCWTFYEMYDSV